ncbi:hypothetical protein RRG08_003726 [Elysia crispata]|uniref:Uncharacterized protein n=1 Tax=Elysia crispata TaxID=231223 RepID=A0AAE1AXD1_9GAST|nr:hypothetical protein RRG08_003726 [Elysia crispata]
MCFAKEAAFGTVMVVIVKAEQGHHYEILSFLNLLFVFDPPRCLHYLCAASTANPVRAALPRVEVRTEGRGGEGCERTCALWITAVSGATDCLKLGRLALSVSVVTA